MARPKKSGIDFYSMDTNFYTQTQTRLLKKEIGFEGICFYQYIAGVVLDKGYYSFFDDDLKLDICDYFSFDDDKINEYLRILLDKNFLDKELFKKYNILTSKKLQAMFLKVIKGRSSTKLTAEYLLITPFDILEEITKKTTSIIIFDLANTKHTILNKIEAENEEMKRNILNSYIGKTHQELLNLINSGETPINSGETLINPDETPINSGGSTQREKEREKEKEKEREKEDLFFLFSEFHKKYPSVKKPAETEFKKLQSNNPNWEDDIEKLLPALEKEIRYKEHQGKSAPPWKHLSNWLLAQCWLDEIPDVEIEGDSYIPLASPEEEAKQNKEFYESLTDEEKKLYYSDKPLFKLEKSNE